MDASDPARLSLVIVATNERPELELGLPVWLSELGGGDEIIVVDNASTDGTADAVARVAPAARLIRNERNEGFGLACNRGAAEARGELLLLLNSDVRPAPGFREAMLEPLRSGRTWGAWMPLVTYEAGALINTSGGIVHFTGISWAGQVGLPVADCDPEPREVAFVPGGAMAARREVWERLGGFAPGFFMYCEDLDLSLRLRLEGIPVGIVPDARLDHDYEFAKNPAKLRFLERNRWATILRTYPAPLLALALPALLLTELALWPAALAGGWGRHKLAATLDMLRALPRLARERRAIQARRTVSAAEFAACMTAELSSPYLGRIARLAPVRWVPRGYWRLIGLLLREKPK